MTNNIINSSYVGSFLKQAARQILQENNIESINTPSKFEEEKISEFDLTRACKDVNSFSFQHDIIIRFPNLQPTNFGTGFEDG